MIIDLFAGPGGWSEGLRALGLSDFGLEVDADACATRYAAGHATWQVDVTDVDPTVFAGRCWGLIASPPCTDWSRAGNRAGRAGATGWLVDLVPEWVEALRPAWVVCEQVPSVLPVWRSHALRYRELGYSSYVGIMNAANYGVPQTRERAILMARRGPKSWLMPEPTHNRHGTSGRRKWVSMADALGWGMTERPYPTIACSSSTGGPDIEKVGGSGARGAIYAEQEAGRWVVNTGRDWQEGGDREDAQTVPLSQPAPSLTAKSGGQWLFQPGGGKGNAERHGGRVERDPVPLDQPAPTIAFGHDAAMWGFTRPATTVMGDARLWSPGHKVNADDRRRLGEEAAADRYGDRAGSDAWRLELWQALVLQSFRADYPLRGSRTAQFQQVGNAVPPVLAAAIVDALLEGWAREPV